MNTIGMAFAQGQAPAGAAGSGWISFVPIILMIVIFYFLLIRPQQKKEKERKNMIASIQKGDKVITVGGLYGIVTNIKEDDIIVLKIADKTNAEFSRSSIQAKVS